MALARPEVSTFRANHLRPHGLELRFHWGDFRVGEYFLPPAPGSSFSVGSEKGVDFAIGDSRLAGKSLDVVRCDDSGFQLRFTKKMDGEVCRRGVVVPLSVVAKSAEVDYDGRAYSLSLGTRDWARVDVGGVALEVFPQPVRKTPALPLSEQLDFKLLNTALILFFLGAFFAISAASRDSEGPAFVDDLGPKAREHLVKLIPVPPPPAPSPVVPIEKEKIPGPSAAAKGEQGLAGKTKAPETRRHSAPKGEPNKPYKVELLPSLLSGPGSAAVSAVLGSDTLGGELTRAVGNLVGSAPGYSGGVGGMGLRGDGNGGGGLTHTTGLGGIGTRGIAGGDGKYGLGIAQVTPFKTPTRIGVDSLPVEVRGSLDKDLIRKVIKDHVSQVRACYEMQLVRHPALAGKVAVQFLIGPDGTVKRSSIDQSDVANPALESCLGSRVLTWVFPKPRGGGVVQVTYPFVFKST